MEFLVLGLTRQQFGQHVESLAEARVAGKLNYPVAIAQADNSEFSHHQLKK
jgi:hypothetical protein